MIDDIVNGHVAAYELTFFVAGAIALVGALVCFVLVRKTDRVAGEAPVFGRRSRWIYAATGRSPAVTKRPPLD